ncbi:MAG: hypothetical protein IPK75_16240, partial [Acidobacteria bacterium]|nr:hypothetical protein [Acidobacteriota bacterium]
MLDDGTEAQFELPRKGAGGAARLAGLVALFLAAAGLAGWWVRDELPFGFLQPAAGPELVAPAPPDWRMARLGEFGEDLRSGVIGIFGTDGGDRMLAYTALGGGEIVAILSHGEADEPVTRASIVRIDGGADLSTADLPVPDGITGASLAPAGVSGFYLAQTGPEGVTLSAYGEGVTPKWERRLIRTAVPKRSAIVLSGDDGLILIGPAETEGRLSVAAYDTTGAQHWQRTFEAPEDGRCSGSFWTRGIFLAYESLVSAGAPRRTPLGWRLAAKLFSNRRPAHRWTPW